MVDLRGAESLAVAALADCGFDVSTRTSTDLRVSTDKESFDVQIKVRRSATYEWDVRRLLDSTSGNVLLVVPRASRAVIALADHEPRLSVVSLDPRLVIWRGARLALDERQTERASTHTASRRSPWGRWALMRTLALADDARTQTALARETGISQPAVSQGLERLADMVERTSDGWRARDRSLMWDEFMNDYAGPGGVTSYWYGLYPITQQTDKAVASGREEDVAALLSGDSAADRLAPWRIPVKGVVYASSALDLRRRALAESEPANATMEVIVPADRTLWVTAATWSSGATVDPLIAAWDLRRSGGPDARESADRLKKQVLGLSASAP